MGTIKRLLMALSGLVAAMRPRRSNRNEPAVPSLPRPAPNPHGLTPLQLRAKAEIDTALNARRTANIRLPRHSGATYLAHVIHEERGGVVVSPNREAARRFEEEHMRMFGKHPDSTTAARAPHQLCGRRGPVVFDAFDPGRWPGQEEAAMHSRGPILLWVDNRRIDPDLIRTIRPDEPWVTE